MSSRKKAVARTLEVMATELQVELKRETGSIIAAGGLLIEIQAQLEHGEWLPWLAQNFPMSIRSAGNYMAAGHLAAKYATVAHLKLRPSALYLLGKELDDPDGLYNDETIKAILSKAENEWINADRAEKIAYELQPPPTPEDDPARLAEEEEEWAQLEARQRLYAEQQAKQQAETDALLDGPPPELPPPSETVYNVIVPPFEQAIKTLAQSRTKPLAEIADTAIKSDQVRAIGDYLYDVAKVIEGGSSDPQPEGKGPTVTLKPAWSEPVAQSAEYLGVPETEYVNLLLQLGNAAFNRKFHKGLTTELGWWLVEMHSKYPDTFNASSWEGSCGHLSIDKLYAARGIPVGKYEEWAAEKAAEKKVA